MLMIVGLIQTWWVLFKLYNAQKAERVRVQENSATESDFLRDRKAPRQIPKGHDQQSSFTFDDEKEVLELDIIDIIKEPIGFEAFMSHLAKEFSMENLLGIVEMSQYKSRYRYIRKIKEEIENGDDPLEKRGSMKITKVIFKVIKSLSVNQQNAPNSEDPNVDDNGNIPVEKWGDDNDTPLDTDDDNDIDNTPQPQSQQEIEINFDKETKRNTLKNQEIGVIPETTPSQDENDVGGVVINPLETEKKTILKKSLSQLKRNSTQLNIHQQVIDLPDTLPFSTIVYGKEYDPDDEEKDIQEIRKLKLEQEAIRIIHALFDKYIYVGSEMELNLSHRLRKRCLEKLSYVDQMDDIELEHMFDKTIGSLLKLMQDSYLRFKETKAFKRYEEKAKKRIRNNSLVNKNDLGGFLGDLM